jgi:hypothetical protein
MTNESQGEDAFITRISDRLRAPELADTGFVARVMSAVEITPADPSIRDVSWWRRRRTLTFTPIGALAVAAALVLAVVSAGTLGRRAPDRDQAAATTPLRDTVHLVRFVFMDSNARAVTLVGTFNDWTRGTIQLAQVGGRGVWSVSIPLDQGRYEYAFVVRDASGEHWVADPYALLVNDDFGTVSSIVSVGGTN